MTPDTTPTGNGAPVRSEALLALISWLAKYQEELNNLRYELLRMSAEDCKEALAMKWPVVQGTRNQIALLRISELPFDKALVGEAITKLSAND